MIRLAFAECLLAATLVFIECCFAMTIKMVSNKTIVIINISYRQLTDLLLTINVTYRLFRLPLHWVCVVFGMCSFTVDYKLSLAKDPG